MVTPTSAVSLMLLCDWLLGGDNDVAASNHMALNAALTPEADDAQHTAEDGASEHTQEQTHNHTRAHPTPRPPVTP